ncbi:unnamed protein product [Ilex paraguariensis]|uniref:Uncharacterized protein n=1 Tax=Ilex paraguariensis TaxID=185542 RepID=A0ABC8SV24_9AQUA
MSKVQLSEDEFEVLLDTLVEYRVAILKTWKFAWDDNLKQVVDGPFHGGDIYLKKTEYYTKPCPLFDTLKEIFDPPSDNSSDISTSVNSSLGPFNIKKEYIVIDD